MDSASSCFFEDEFEEFRARALSGGNLPSISQLKLIQQGYQASGGEPLPDPHPDHHPDHHHHHHHHHHTHHSAPYLGTSLNKLPQMKLSKSRSHENHVASPSDESGSEGPILQFPVPVSSGTPEVSVVVSQDEEKTPSETETESTLVDVGEQEEEAEVKASEESWDTTAGNDTTSGRSYVPLPQNLLQSTRYNTQRLSDGGACYDIDNNKHISSLSEEKNGGEGGGGGGEEEEGAGGEQGGYSDIQERILSHMSWVVLEDDDWHLGEMRPRVSSMPAKSLESSIHPGGVLPNMGNLRRAHIPEGHRVRSYAITPKGVVKKGEVFVNRSSSTSVASNDSESNHSNTSADLPVYRVMVSGEVGVGKRALVHSFLASDADKLDMCSFGKFSLNTFI